MKGASSCFLFKVDLHSSQHNVPSKILKTAKMPK